MKTYLITGASGAIGSALARELLHRGHRVIGTYRRAPLKDLAIDWRPLDMTVAQSRTALLHSLATEPLAGYVDCAGVHVSGPMMALEESALREMTETNLLAPMLLVRGLLPSFSKQRAGSIVLLGSVSAHRMTRGHAVYSATKAGLEGLARALASEMARRGIRVNVVLPGPVASAMLEASQRENGVDPASMVPMGRLIEASEVARACCFLLSDEASAITGVLLPVDGGYSLW